MVSATFDKVTAMSTVELGTGIRAHRGWVDGLWPQPRVLSAQV